MTRIKHATRLMSARSQSTQAPRREGRQTNANPLSRSDVVRHTHGNSRTWETAAQRGGTTRNPTVEDNTAHTRGGGGASQTAGPGHVILSQEPSALGKIGPFHITSLSRYTPTQGEGVARCTRNHHPGREGGIQRTTGRLRVSEAEHTDRHNAGARMRNRHAAIAHR